MINIGKTISPMIISPIALKSSLSGHVVKTLFFFFKKGLLSQQSFALPSKAIILDETDNQKRNDCSLLWMSLALPESSVMGKRCSLFHQLIMLHFPVMTTHIYIHSVIHWNKAIRLACKHLVKYLSSFCLLHLKYSIFLLAIWKVNFA